MWKTFFTAFILGAVALVIVADVYTVYSIMHYKY